LAISNLGCLSTVVYNDGDWDFLFGRFPWVKGYLIMGLVFTVGSSFSLSKTIRDDAEAEKLVDRIKGAKTEQILKEYET